MSEALELCGENLVGSRARAAAWVEHPWFTRFILFLILVNGVTLGLETSPAILARHGELLNLLNGGILVAFVVELGLKLFAYRGAFFRSGWNLFDLAVVGIALLPTSGQWSVLRLLRILRVLRLISQFPQLRLVVDALLGSLKGIAAIAGLLLVLYYVCAVIATNLFGGAFPDWFGTLGRSFYSLFQIMTLESWSMGISRPVMEVFPWAWAFFVPFILLATFTMLNLFIAIIVNSMQTLQDQATRETLAAVEEDRRDTHALESEVRELRDEIAALRHLLTERRGERGL